MGKNFFKLVKKMKHWFVRLVTFLALILVLVALSILITNEGDVTAEQYGQQLLAVISDIGFISTLVAAILSIFTARILMRLNRRMEESLKTEDDHHKIIAKYSGHSKQVPMNEDNLVCQDGVFMHVPCLDNGRKKVRNKVRRKFSEEHLQAQQSIDDYAKGTLYIPSVNVFANVNGNTDVVFRDNTDKFVLPSFVGENSLRIMDAHKTSEMSNGATVRLNYFEYSHGDNGRDCIVLDTCRTQYFDMLLTNRCMDFELSNGLTLRKIYENGKKVTPLEVSKLGNQIGINGLVVTSDGYLLVEKRGYKKTVWKNKFAQPISLALKVADLGLKYDQCLQPTIEEANNKLKKVIFGTLEKNFNITSNEIVSFDLSENFMGIARDLLEGGKPNFYFYVVVNKTAQELAEYISKFAENACNLQKFESDKKLRIGDDKFQSDYYLVPYEDFKLNYEYELQFDANRIIHIKRKFAPRFKLHMFDGARYNAMRATNVKFKRDCGEALLACLYYSELCKPRIFDANGNRILK